MHDASPEPPLEQEEDDERENEMPTRMSFFADGERADEIVCADVWRMYGRARGGERESHLAPAVLRELAASLPPERWELHRTRNVAPIERSTTSTEAPQQREETAMAKTDDLTDIQRRALDAYNMLKPKLGREPTNPEIANAIGLQGTDGAKAQAARKLRDVLVEHGLAKAAPRGGKRLPVGDLVKREANAPSKKPKTNGAASKAIVRHEPKATTKATNGHPPRPAFALASNDDELLAQLISRRDAHADKVAALTIAIEALGGGGRSRVSTPERKAG